MPFPLMPKATAVWLVDNTTLTFEQVAEFCGMHILEVQAIADGDVGTNIIGIDPVIGGQLSKENIAECEKDSSKKLVLLKGLGELSVKKMRKEARYTSVSKRQDRPDAIMWLLKHHPDLPDAQIKKLIGTTKQSIDAVRNKTHWNAQNIKARNPVMLGLCTEADLETAVRKIRRKPGAEAASEAPATGETEN